MGKRRETAEEECRLPSQQKVPKKIKKGKSKSENKEWVDKVKPWAKKADQEQDLNQTQNHSQLKTSYTSEPSFLAGKRARIRAEKPKLATLPTLPHFVIASSLLPRQVTARAKTQQSFSSFKPPQQPAFKAKNIIGNYISLPEPSVEESLGGSIFRGGTSTYRDARSGSVRTNSVRFQTFERVEMRSDLSSSAAVGDPVREIKKPRVEDTQAAWNGSIVNSSTPSSSTPAEAIETMSIRGADTLIRAERIIARPVNKQHKYAYPYGNYPNYYEKRSQEQKADKSTKLPSSTPSLSTSRSASSPLLQPSRPQHKRNDRWTVTPSVLIPPSVGISHRDVSCNNKTSLKELAGSVDLRLKFLEPDWFRGKKVLDIGCNAALLTVFIALHFKPVRIQGVDIDPSLIGKAQSFVLKTFSQISPHAYRQDGVDSTQDDVPYESYFPKSMHRMHGFLPVPEATSQTRALFPHNIELRIADWVTEQGSQEANAEQWDVVIGFSLTKWVHLHHGDAGLKQFFKKIYNSLAPNGILLLEPQAYATYAKRKKITAEMLQTYEGIVFRPEQFQEYLLSSEIGFKECFLLGHPEGAARNFNRDIYLYRK
ncbi:hypothetical protein EDD11_008781 [Mortierella claussenii]|nr:hypothetical protein EDD11_008781 [Mortierella claussenii]